MENQSAILFDEIRQLIEQYKAEVPGRRHAWPVSIKTRVLDLCNVEGMRLNEVATRTGLPYHTVLNWRFQNKTQESVVAFRAVTVTPPRALVPSEPMKSAY